MHFECVVWGRVGADAAELRDRCTTRHSASLNAQHRHLLGEQPIRTDDVARCAQEVFGVQHSSQVVDKLRSLIH